MSENRTRTGPSGSRGKEVRDWDNGIAREGKYLTFTLALEEYGIGILKVKEIMGLMPITSVPRMPPFVKGVINLRGKVIPIIDLRLKFSLSEIEPTDKTCIIVVEVDGAENQALIGLVVDSVSEVLNIREGDIEDPPELGADRAIEWFLGMAKMDSGVKILLDIDKVVTADEVAGIRDV